MNARELAKWIKESVRFQKEHAEDDWTFHCVLDADFAVHLGWLNGFDAKDTGVIHATDDPEYCLSIKVGENSNDGYAWCYMPWNADEGREVWDTCTALSPAENFYETAKWLLSEYRAMRKALREGRITFSN